MVTDFGYCSGRGFHFALAAAPERELRRRAADAERARLAVLAVGARSASASAGWRRADGAATLRHVELSSVCNPR